MKNKCLLVGITLLLYTLNAMAVTVHHYALDSNLSDSDGGGDLVGFGGILTGSRYAFEANTGLLNTHFKGGSYTINMRFNLDEIESTGKFVKLMDFGGLTLDTGLYKSAAEEVMFFPFAQGAATTEFSKEQFVTLTITRASDSKEVVVYLNGIQQLSFMDEGDEAVVDEASLHFFVDDNENSGESSAGSVDYIRFFDHPLDANAVASLGNCLEGVDIDSKLVRVFPSGADDTGNVQCAVDSAIAGEIPRVRLMSGDFRVSQVIFDNFKGNFQGNTRNTTNVTSIDGAISCGLIRDSGRQPAVFKFIGGSPTVSNMQIMFGAPCANSEDIRGLHFTGRNAFDSCGNDTIFAAVDRVDIQGAEPEADRPLLAIEVSGEGYRQGGCNDLLSGTFKVNRSTFRNLGNAVLTSLRAASPVDIRFNDFEAVNVAVWLRDSNQDATIANNEFRLLPYTEEWTRGVLVETTVDNPPATTSARISRNNFISFTNALAVQSYQLTGPSVIVFSVAFNTFDFTAVGAGGIGIIPSDINNGIINGNTFLGNQTAVQLGDNALAERSLDWSITGNTMSENQLIWLINTVGNSVVGAGQTNFVIDDGTGNFVLE